ncbi:hypothetical protein FRB94_008882 [Tulasnella sp. JGI-2019a]|nr:hypothetical protein FRB94_008882 [Tulasnella sp. JGI-2019a]KAG9000775.1 hypothetical protein FRB93_012601 [Tulasnella sp. JGI-2019a]
MAVRPARGSSAQKSARGKLVVDVLVPTLKQLYRSQTIPVHAGKSHQQSDPFDNLQSSTNKVFVRSTSKDSSRKAKASKTKPKLENAHKPSPRKRKIISQQTDQSNDDEQNVYIEREYTRIYAVRRTFDDTPIGLAGARMSSTLMRKAHGNNDDEVIGTRAGFNGYIDHPHRQPSSSRSGSVGATTHARAPIQRTKSTYKTPAAIQFQAALTELIRVKSEASDLSRDELIKAYAQLRDIRDDLKELLEKIVEP